MLSRDMLTHNLADDIAYEGSDYISPFGLTNPVADKIAISLTNHVRPDLITIDLAIDLAVCFAIAYANFDAPNNIAVKIALNNPNKLTHNIAIH